MKIAHYMLQPIFGTMASVACNTHESQCCYIVATLQTYLKGQSGQETACCGLSPMLFV